MRNILIAVTLATGLAAVVATPASAGRGYGASYAYEYCHYYKSRALGAKNQKRKNLMWAKYRACLREYGG